MIITVANRKGGTGKTTSVINIAAIWGVAGKKTLIIDLDTQNHCAIGCGIRSLPDTQIRAHDIFKKNKQPLSEGVITTPIKNVSLIAADETFEGGVTDDPVRLRQAIVQSGLAAQFDHILIDTPPTLDTILINAMSAADGVIVPFVPHHLSAVGVAQLTKLFLTVAMRYNKALKLFGVAPIMADRKMRLHRAILDKMALQYGKKRILHGIRMNVKLAEAFAEQQPVITYAPTSNGAKDYGQLVEDIETLLEH